MSPTRGTRRPYKLIVRLISVTCALSVMLIYSLSTNSKSDLSLSSSRLSANSHEAAAPLTGRRLFSYEPVESSNFFGNGSDPTPSGDDDGGDNCTAPRSHHVGYNDSCAFVTEECSGEWVLFDYLKFILCDMRHVQVSLSVVWLAKVWPVCV